METSTAEPKINWNLCILCQKITQESLQCPARSKRADIGVGYVSLEESILSFKDLGEVPLNVSPESLNNGTGIANTLQTNQASWHKSCKYKFNKNELQRAQKRKSDQQPSVHSPAKTRSSFTLPKPEHNRCFFCDEIDNSGTLHSASTKQVDEKVKRCAVQLEDRRLLAKLACGDMISLEAHCHLNCLVSLYNKVRQLDSSIEQEKRELSPQGVAFAEIVSYIDEFLEAPHPSVPVLKLADLASIYSHKLEELGFKTESRVNSTRLKDRILSVFPELSAHPQGRDVLLLSSGFVGDAIKKVCQEEVDDQAVHLAKAARIVRKEIFECHQSFNGTFPQGCQSNSVPASLKVLVNMILRGPSSIRARKESKIDQACLSISQLLLYNTTTRDNPKSTVSRHNREKECPLPIYIGLKIHGMTRGRTLIDALHGLGICISYDRVLGISTDVANSVCALYERDGVVCPPKLRHGVLTTAEVDNVDHNPSSTTSRGSFHGTGISLIQHVTTEVPGTCRPQPLIDVAAKNPKKIGSLPSQYVDVQPATVNNNVIYVPAADMQLPDSNPEHYGYTKEVKWLQHVEGLYSKERLEESDVISWAAFHSSTPQTAQILNYEPAVVSLLPLFEEKADSVAMIMHAMNVIRSAVHNLNPGQVPVVALDQPLFALAKQIQWSYPQTHGEDHFIIMFGGLHIE